MLSSSLYYDSTHHSSTASVTIINNEKTDKVYVVKRWYDAYGTQVSGVSKQVTMTLYNGDTGTAIETKSDIVSGSRVEFNVTGQISASGYYVTETAIDGFVTRYSAAPLTNSRDEDEAHEAERYVGNATGSNVKVAAGGTLYVMNTPTRSEMQVELHKKWIEFRDPTGTAYEGQLDGDNTWAERQNMKLTVKLVYEAYEVGNLSNRVGYGDATPEFEIWVGNTDHAFGTSNTIQVNNLVIQNGPTLKLIFKPSGEATSDFLWLFNEQGGTGQENGVQGMLPAYKEHRIHATSGLDAHKRNREG